VVTNFKVEQKAALVLVYMDVSEKTVFTLKGMMAAAGSCQYFSVSLNLTKIHKKIITIVTTIKVKNIFSYLFLARITKWLNGFPR